MTIQSSAANWLLCGGIVAAFFGLPYIVTPEGSPSSPDQAEVEIALETPEEAQSAPRALRVIIPQITLDTRPTEDVIANPFPEALAICGSVTVSHSPKTESDLQITGYRPFITVNGVKIAMAPIESGCFSSGFGLRSGHLHKGVDFHSPRAVKIYAASDGIVREKTYRDDYGHMIVLEHGSGVFTRYAHLQGFAVGLQLNETVAVGSVIGLMGNSAKYDIPRHLHYEVLTGEWAAQAGSFGLSPFNLYAGLSEN